jgi:hypothetical protein
MDDSVIEALARAHGKKPTVKGAAAKRKARERSAINPNDGRVKRTTGRTVQLATKISPELKDRLVKAARNSDRRLTITEIIEQALGKFLDELEKGAKRA